MDIKMLRQGLSSLFRRKFNARIPTWKKGNKVYVYGVEDKYSGLYYVDEVSHSFSAQSYRVVFKLTRNDTGE